MARKRKDLSIPYGISDFRRIRNEAFYYVDKTQYLARMEERDSFIFFVRPRRFGKSLFISMMESYYDLNRKKEFKKLFGDLWIGKHPTKNANRFMTLKLDFSKVGGVGDALEQAFEQHISDALDTFVRRYPGCYDKSFVADFGARRADSKFASIVYTAKERGIPLYLIIDEYDNFTNQMIRATGVEDYREITHGAGFYRNWFKKFKGEFDRIFMTGVSPVTMDDLTSGFNIAANLTLDEDFNAALGFPERTYHGDVPHSYIVEFKYAKNGAKKAEMAAQREEGAAQLRRYAEDRKVPALAKGTTLHLVLVQYRGPKMANCELVAEKGY